MDKGIEVGDKVRIANNAPSEYRYGFNYRLRTQESEVVELDDDGYMAAIVPMCVNDKDLWFQIPTKYLIKVNAEAKEPKFKVGDKVRIISMHGRPTPNKGEVDVIAHINIGNEEQMYYLENHYHCAYGFSESDLVLYTESTAPTIKVGDRVRSKGYGLEAVVLGIDGEFIAVRRDDGIKQEWKWYMTELVQPTEQPEAEKTKTKGETLTFPIVLDLNGALEGCDCLVSIREQIRKAQRDIEENHKPRYIPKIMFNTEFWVKYEAGLAKEVALKVANKYNDPKEAAEYAVSVAKAVVKGLKRK